MSSSVKVYTYPRVNISTAALTHSNTAAEAADTTVLLGLFLADRGPSDTIERIHTLSQFENVYGDLDYSRNGQTALNLYNWLSNGGTVYAKRLTAADSESTVLYNAYPDSSTGIYGTMKTSSSAEVSFHYTKTDTVFTLYLGDSTTATEGTPTYLAGYDNVLASFVSADNQSYTVTSLNPVFTSKYAGSWYKNIVISISASGSTSSPIYSISVVYKDANSKTELESFKRLTKDNIKVSLASSDYIALGSGYNESALPAVSVTSVYTLETPTKIVTEPTDINDAIKYYFTESTGGTSLAKKDLSNKLETPIDLILDAGYSVDVKKLLINFISNADGSSSIRDDIVGIFDTTARKVVNSTLGVMEDVEDTVTTEDTGFYPVATNIAFYTQYFTIKDAIFNNQDIYVTPTYFLSKLIAYNDNQYGIQFPTAGVTRGTLEDAIGIHTASTTVSANPTPDEKETFFTSRINYVEKTPREYAFMCQRTHDGSTEAAYTALSFLNNERCLEKMKKEIEALGREYLFEFNDSTTLANMSSVLNKYLTEWINNRTLEKGTISVSADATNSEAVNATLVIKFTGTIEYLSVDITIE